MAIEMTECRICEKAIPENRELSSYCDPCRAVAKAEYMAWLAGVWSGAPRYRNGVKVTIQSPPDDYYGATYETLDAKHPGLQAKVLPFLNGDIRMMALLSRPGVGKTWAAWAVMFGYLVKNFDRLGSSATFIDWGDLCFAASDRDNFGEKGETARQHLLDWMKCGLLIIDEFGTTRPSNNQKLAIDQLINVRKDYHRPTLVTSTQSVAELTQNIGSHFVSRFARGTIMLNGPDLRL